MRFLTTGLLLFFCSMSLPGQTCHIGQKEIVYTDPSRNGRKVPVSFFYPATASGEDAPIVGDLFPVIVFGHGFLMNYSAYRYLWEGLVPGGYIVAMVNTENSHSPVHAELALDMSFVKAALQRDHIDPESFFNQRIDSKTAFMGHSMGGGCAFIAAACDAEVNTMITLAAMANTNPSAVNSASSVSIPALVIAAEKDRVTPPAQNQLLLYDSLASGCKTYINVSGGSHCYFGEENRLCDLGELIAGSNPTISRAAQHELTLSLIRPWLDYYLKGREHSEQKFLDSLINSDRITYKRFCPVSAAGHSANPPDKISLHPNPNNGDFYLDIPFDQGLALLEIVSVTGKVIYTKQVSTPFHGMIRTGNPAKGLYLAHIKQGHKIITKKLIIR